MLPGYSIFQVDNPAGIYLFKVKNSNTRAMCDVIT